MMNPQFADAYLLSGLGYDSLGQRWRVFLLQSILLSGRSTPTSCCRKTAVGSEKRILPRRNQFLSPEVGSLTRRQKFLISGLTNYILRQT